MAFLYELLSDAITNHHHRLNLDFLLSIILPVLSMIFNYKVPEVFFALFGWNFMYCGVI